jgi:CRP-like cAMP-binding protein
MSQEKSNLIPLDVWLAYQRERGQADGPATEAGVLEIGVADLSRLEGAGASIEVMRAALSPMGLSEDVSDDSLQALSRRSRQAMVPAGEYLFRENEPAASFYVVLEGTVEVLRSREDTQVALRHLKRGDSTGLFGLFSGERRAASARAIGDVGVLEVPFPAFNDFFAQVAALRPRMLRYYQERLLEGFFAFSTLFQDVESIARGRLMSRFATRKLVAGDTWIQPGEVTHQIAVILSGSLMIEDRSRPGANSKLYQAFPGEFVALTHALSGLPGRMRVYSPEESYLAWLPHKDLAELLRDHPPLRSLATRLPNHARTLQKDFYVGHTGIPGL